MSTVTVPLSRRERRVRETRQAIVAAAESLFRAQGYGPTTIEQIAERADVAPRTFFRYFPTKESVLFADAPDRRRRMVEALEARPATEHPFTSMVAVVRSFADEVGHDVAGKALRHRIAAEHESVRAYERLVLETETADAVVGFVARRLGVDPDQDPRPRVWAGIAMTTFGAGYRSWMDGGQKGTLRRAFDRSLSAAVAALDAIP
ncbi:MAG: TetR/AcrR family transcriptional regulator [Acidimicrobiia bacterium]